jgi:hypothetical protein
VLHATTVEVLKSIRTYQYAYRAAFAHPDRERLPLVKRPALVMADADDPLRTGVDEAAALLAGSCKLIFTHRGAGATAAKAAMLARFLDDGVIS